MITVGFLVRLEAKPGKEEELAAFLMQGFELANRETTTPCGLHFGVTLEARSGKEADADAFLKSAQPLALNKNGTLKWYAIKLGPGKFGIFDIFANEGGRKRPPEWRGCESVGGAGQRIVRYCSAD